MVGASVRFAWDAAQGPDDGAARVQDLDLQLSLGLVLQEVGNRRAARRIRKIGGAGAVGIASETPSDGVGNRKHVHARRGDLFVEVTYRPQVVEDPQRAAVCGDDQVVIFDDEIVDGDRRQVQLEIPPGFTAVGREHDSALGAEIELSLLLWILSHRVQIHILRKFRVDALPRLAVVGCLKEVRMHVVEPVRVNDHVGNRRIEWRWLNDIDGAPLGQAGHPRRDVGPRLTTISRELYQAVVAARPNQSLLHRRFSNREDGVVGLDAGVVAGDRTARPFLLRFVVARQIGANHIPAVSAVGRAEDDLRAVIDHLRVVRRGGNRRGPLEPVFHVFAAVS